MWTLSRRIWGVSAPNDNVLIVPSRNVLLTGSGLRGGFRNTSHDATGSRPVGRIEKSKEGTDHATASRRGTRPERAAHSSTVEAIGCPGRRGPRAFSARTAVQPQAGRQDPAEGAGDTGPRCLSRLRPDAGGGIPGQQTRHSCRTRDSAYLDDRRQAVACQPAASREDPPVAAASLPSRGVGAVGYQRARLAGGSWAEALLDQYDRRRLQPHSRAVRAERLYRREYAFALEIRGAIWTAGPLLHGQGQSISNRAEDRPGQQSATAGRARSVTAHADRTSPGRVGHRVDRGTLVAGQGAGGTQFSDGAGPSGERLAGSRAKTLEQANAYLETEFMVWWNNNCRGAGQQRRCSPALRQGTLAGGIAELCGEQTDQQRLYDPGQSPNLADRTRRYSRRLAGSPCTSRGSARWGNGGAFPRALPGGEPMPATSPGADPQSDRRPRAKVCRATRQKPMDGELPPHQPRKGGSVGRRGVTTGSRRKTNSVGRAKTARPVSRLLYSKPLLGSLTKVSWPQKAKPPEGTPQGPVNRGLAAVYFGANSVASALNLPQERDLPKNQSHSKPPLSNSIPKPDISTWQRIGHFYLALTGEYGP